MVTEILNFVSLLELRLAQVNHIGNHESAVAGTGA
jgi:hypothetical protein